MQRRRHLRQARQQRVGQRGSGGVVQRRQVDALVAGLRRPARLLKFQCRTRAAQQQGRRWRRTSGVSQVLDEVQAAGVGPLQVIDEKPQRQTAGRDGARGCYAAGHGNASGDGLQGLRGVEEAAVAQLPPFEVAGAEQRLHLLVRGEVQAQQVAQHGGVAGAGQQGAHGLQPGAAQVVGGVAVEQAEVAREELPQQAVGLAGGPRAGMGLKPAHARGPCLCPAAELGRQA